MPVPEAAMDKDDGFVAGKDNVGASGEFTVVRRIDGKTVAGTVEQAAELNLRLGVFAFDPRHIPGTALFCQVISHILYYKS